MEAGSKIVLCAYSQVVYSERGAEVSLIDQTALSLCKNRIIQLLYPLPEGSMPLRRVLELHKEKWGQDCPLSYLTDHMDDVVMASRFSPLQCKQMKENDYKKEALLRGLL